MPRRHSSLEIEVQQLLSQVSASQTTLHSLNAGIRVAKETYGKLKDQITVQTQRLLKEQAIELDAYKQAANKTVVETITRRTELETENQAIMLTNQELESQAQELTEIITSQQDTLSNLDQRIQAAQQKLEQIAKQIPKATEDLAKAQVDTNQYKDLKLDLEEEITKLKTTRAEMANLVAAEEAKFNNNKAEREFELNRFGQKLLAIKQDSLKTQAELDRARKEVADRTLALDEREQVLKRREFRAEQDESDIRSNATLLDL